ncbi:hypothetical protein AAG570_012576 [Ranatra chinensis]|uniref:Envelope protein n=1 Tax=Ranatra chinensis TaxID=642074 RepID=A0ABD0YE83_9HEMI
MDATDEKQIHETVNFLKSSQQELKSQIKNLYTVNNDALKRINKSLSTLNQNELSLLHRVNLLAAMFTNSSKTINDILPMEVCNRFLHSLISVNDYLNSIQTSLTFCQLGVIHPSIVTRQDLKSNLEALKELHPKEIVPPVNLIIHPKLIKPKCVTTAKSIIYFIEIPLFENKINPLLFLLPTPSPHHQVIIPRAQWIIKKQTRLVPTEQCDWSGIKYFCVNKNNYINMSCEENVIVRENFNTCMALNVNTEDNADFVPDISAFLLTAIGPARYEETCHGEWHRATLQGTFIIQPETNCSIRINGSMLTSESLSRLPSPPAPIIASGPITRLPARLPPLTLERVKLPAQIKLALPTVTDQPSVHIHWSATSFLYLIVVAVALTYAYTKYRRPHQPTDDTTAAAEETQQPPSICYQFRQRRRR